MIYQQDPGLERRRKLAQAMKMQGLDASPVQHPMQAIARLAQAYAGGKIGGDIEEQEAQRRREFSDILTGALETGDRSQLAKVLAGSPETAPYALQVAVQKPSASSTPSAIKEYEYYSKLSPEDRLIYEKSQRKPTYLDTGPSFVQPESGETFEKGLKPSDEPEIIAEQEAAKESAKQFEAAKGKWRASESKLRMTISGTKARQKVIEDSIEKAKSLLGKNTTSFGALISRWPTTESKRLSNLLDTIKANVGFTELQSMRDASPTGGALGQVSEMENRLLQSVLGSLDQAGDSEDLRSVLDTILVQRQGTIDRLEAAYEMDKASYGSRAEEQKEVVKPEDGEGYSMEDLEYTAKQHGITVEEVKRRLGGK